MKRGLLIISFVLMSFISITYADEPTGLSLADLAGYRDALAGKDKSAMASDLVTFRDLWEHPDRYQGHWVRLEGRVMRRFRQGSFGTFPALVEAWAVSPAGDPFCLVFPATPTTAVDPAPGASISFAGKFLRQLRYQGGDVARLAPLIVGDVSPTVTRAAPLRPAEPGPAESGRGLAWFEWTFGLTAGLFVALALARQHLRGPVRARIVEEEAPRFFDEN